MVFVVSAAVEREPLIGRLPDHPPEAVQLFALLEVQVNSEVAPLGIVVGLAPNDTLGGIAATVTTADCDAAPPGPSQVSVNVVVVPRATVFFEPLTGWAPDHPPDARQLVALLAFQLKVADEPLCTVDGLAVSVTTGGAALTDTVTVWVATPPGPEHFRE